MSHRIFGILLALAFAQYACLADSITVNGETYDNVYVVESSVSWVVCFPSDGTTKSFSKAGAKDVKVSRRNSIERASLYHAWKLASETRKSRESGPAEVRHETTTPGAAPLGSIAGSNLASSNPVQPEVLEIHADPEPEQAAPPNPSPSGDSDGDHSTIPAVSETPLTTPDTTVSQADPAPIPSQARETTTASDRSQASSDPVFAMQTADWVRCALLIMLALGAAGVGGLIVLSMVGAGFSAAFHAYAGLEWNLSIQAGLACAYGLILLPLLLQGGKAFAVLAVPGALLAAITLLVSHYAFKTPWAFSSADAAVAFGLAPLALIRTLLVTGVIKKPAPPEPPPSAALSRSSIRSTATSYGSTMTSSDYGLSPEIAKLLSSGHAPDAWAKSGAPEVRARSEVRRKD